MAGLYIFFCAFFAGIYICDGGYCTVYYQVVTKYAKKTGWFGWGRQTEYKTVTMTRAECCNGWDGSHCNNAICGRVWFNKRCNRNEGRVVLPSGQVITSSGGTCDSPGVCTECKTGYYSSSGAEFTDAFCRMCEQISNCDLPQCTTFENTRCEKCSGETQRVVSGRNAYIGDAPSYKSCIEACSWREGRRCYPGDCGNNYHFSECTCADGFEGKDNDCSTVSSANKPSITEQSLKLEGDGDTPLEFIDFSNAATDKVWTNELSWKTVSIHVSSKFQPNYVAADLAKPYILSESIGVKELSFEAVFKRDHTSLKWSETKICNYETSCSLTYDNLRIQNINWISGYSLRHRDAIEFTVTAENGGVVRYKSFETNKEMSYVINGVQNTNTMVLGFDTLSPKHCFELKESCATDALTTPDFIKTTTFSVSWGGWTDDDSGLDMFEFGVYTLINTDGSFVQKTLVYNEIVSASSGTFTTDLHLSDIGPHAVELIAIDKAGNHKIARRILMFDNTAKVDIQGNSSIVEESNELGWITELKSHISINWYGRFININHVSNHWLDEVAPSGTVSRDLDDTDGRSERTTSAVHNINGTLRVEVAYTVTLNGTVQEVDYVEVPLDSFDEQRFIIYGEDFTDGKRIDFRIRAYDMMDEYNQDNVTVFIDLSPPVIENLWLTNEDFLNISVHSVTELNEITFEWEVYDVHSGIHEVLWRIFDNYTQQEIEHGQVYASPQNETTLEECVSTYASYPRGSNCYCSPFNGCFHKHFQIQPSITTTGEDGIHSGLETGTHDHDYFIEVTATNNAGVSTARFHKITIDTSPPQEGSVHDGISGQPEVDFQQGLQISAHWDGFFDKESSVWFYLYAFGTTCFQETDFDIHNTDSTEVHQTYSTSALYSAPTKGKYYITVVAYNHALDGSKPVCSDGVTVDSTPATVSEIILKDSITASGLIRDNQTDQVFYMAANREIVEIDNPSQTCLEKATLVPNAKVATFPHKRYLNGTKRSQPASVCENTTGVHDSSMMFTKSDAHLQVSWNVTYGASGVYDYEVGLSSQDSTFPDILEYQSTHHHTFKTILHPNIVEGETFYILIKTTTNSGISDTKTIGPFTVIKSPPTFQGSLTVRKEIFENNIFLIVDWEQDDFVDPVDPHPLDFQVSVGTSTEGQDILPFERLSYGGSCQQALPLSCTAINVEILPWSFHGQHNYFITIKASNRIGLYVLTSITYKHDIELASRGLVHDVDPNIKTEFIDIDDIDFQSNNDTVAVRWDGFDHPYEDIAYIVCLSEGDGNDYITCSPVESKSSHVFTDLTLAPYQTYYQTVIAVTEAGNTTVTSDGVTVVIENDHLSGVIISDGPRCNLSDTRNDINLDKHHHTEDKRPSCQNNLEYQTSTNKLEVHWVIPEDKRHISKDVYWTVEEKAPIADFWTAIRPFMHLKSVDHLHHSDLILTSGRKYRISLQFCAEQYCFMPLQSDGVTVIPNPPSTGHINVIETESKLTVEMAPFRDSDIEDEGEQLRVMDHYEWAFTDSHDDGRLITKWKRINMTDQTENNIKFEIDLQGSISFTKCWKVSVRGYTKAGLSSSVSSEIRNCSDIQQVRSTIVIDATGEPSLSSQDGHEGQGVYLEENAKWSVDDIDYTPYSNIFSAVWPTLRHRNYTWAVLRMNPDDPLTFYKPSEELHLQDPCSHPNTQKCGHTSFEYVNAVFADHPLEHGQRYMICVLASNTTIEHEFWTQQLDDVNTCSDGMTVDLTPPTTADVWIGLHKGNRFQTSTSDMTVYWESFTDVEEYGYAVHSSGISSYDVAIGTSSGGTDVVSFTSVGLMNHHTFSHLTLQGGHTYFATVKAYDFTNQTSQSVSEAMKVDTTPPTRTGKSISVGDRHIKSTRFISACWYGAFEDSESGISHYEWCVGTHAGYDNVMDYIISVEECGQTPADNHLTLMEGHLYFVTVKAYNNAGLFSLQSSWAISVDVSGPIPGHIFDGAYENGSVKDIDFTTNSSVIKAHWTDFHDPHTIVKEYFISIGTCRTCEDILSRYPVGVVNSFTIGNQHLSEGVKYFAIVTACNTADLCSSASSDGFIVDTTHPVPGHVLDGIHGKDIRYQSSRQVVGCRWYGFYDTQSGISHYVWRLGLSKGADDILPSRNVHKSQEGLLPDYQSLTGGLLPNSLPIFCTVRAYNKAGMYTEMSSNGFIIDDTAPIFSIPLTQSTIGSIVDGTSILRSVLKVYWQVEDTESYIEAQYLSISSHVGGDFNSSSTWVPGVVRDFTFTDLDLHDGSYYDVKLVACNGGKLCQQSILSSILVDSTPPTTGVFAINTDHAAALNRQPEGWMTWNALQVQLAWLGFEDLHSGIQFYSVNVGSQFMGDDLNQDPGNPYIIQHDTNVTFYEDGMVQTYSVFTKSLLKYNTIYISLTATNQVGLNSSILHSQFDLLYGGIMSLVRRCDSHTCMGHCVCAPHHQLCHSENTTCSDSTGTYAPVTVNDYIDLRFPTDAAPISFSPLNTMLASRWTVQETTSSVPQWYEWSVGETAYDTPIGVFDQAEEKVWHEVGTGTRWIVTFDKGRELMANVKYSFFVKAWYSDNVFSIYKSPGVIINPFTPKATVIRGRRVKEVSPGLSSDIDFFSKTALIEANWTGKFLNSDGSLAKYHLYLSTIPGGHDAHVLSTGLSPSITLYDLTGLHFENDTKYYTVVQAFNHAGLHTTEVSDGFMIDTSPPKLGVVHDGKAFADIHATSSVNSANFFWYGFSDTESGIKHYEYCVSSLHSQGLCDIHPFTSVGIATQAEVSFSQPVEHGTVIIGEVRAYDAAGHVSSVVTSSGVIVDTTPPLRATTLQCGSNLIHDSLFVNTFAVQNYSVVTELTCLQPMSNDWAISDDSCVSFIAYEQESLSAENIIILKGSLLQELDNIGIGKYHVTFFTSTVIIDTLHKWSTEGFVEVNGERRIFLLYTKPNGHEFTWQKHSLWYQIDDNTAPITIAIGTANRQQVLALKDISLQKCDLDSDNNANSLGHVKAHTAFVHDWSSIHAEWSFLDPESGIEEYLWAIGTVQGGTQLQSFTSVGRQTFAYTSSLKFVHDTVVYVTIVAVNGAGLRTVSYSDPVVIDLTPPVFHHIYDGMETDTDIDFQKGLRIDVNWLASDPESSLQNCYWALGLFEGDTSVMQFTQADYNKAVLTTTLSGNPNATLYATIRCTNGAGLTSSSSSDGIRILQHPPMLHDVILNVLTTSATQYSARDHYHGNATEIRFRWTGFNSDEGIDSCLVSLKGLGTDVSELVKTNYIGYTYASFTGLNLGDGEYTVSIVALNDVQMTSEKISTTFYLLANPPRLTEKPFVTAWYESTSTAHCSWEDAFSSEQPLYYEVTVRLSEGGKGDIVQWQETINTFIDINIEVDNITPSGVDVKFIVRAIGPSGLFTSASTELYIP